MTHAPRVVYSFVLDDDPKFAYQAWHLARSLVERCGAAPASVHVQCTPETGERTRALFRERGYAVHAIARFGDGRYCNKLSQFDALREADFDVAVLLDTDTIATGDLRSYVRRDAISAKVVDAERPPLETLREIALASGLKDLPPVRATDAGDGETFEGNCNGGFYAVPHALCEPLAAEWKRRTSWLLENLEPLRRTGREQHADQVGFWLALRHAGLPFAPAPSNANYFVHFTAPHRYHDPSGEIALLHYHDGIGADGALAPAAELAPAARQAVERANALIATNYAGSLFWDVRYRHFAERGSGIGSRGEHAEYKRALMRAHGVECASSVLDVGCGDLEVIKELDIAHYVGLDTSAQSIELARKKRPDWEFRLGLDPSVAPAEMVLCFEVLIHQPTEEAYRALIAFLAAKTERTLLVSGLDGGGDAVESNPIVFFHEPLERSLRRTGRFGTVARIGAHTGVVVYRCDVAA